MTLDMPNASTVTVLGSIMFIFLGSDVKHDGEDRCAGSSTHVDDVEVLENLLCTGQLVLITAQREKIFRPTELVNRRG